MRYAWEESWKDNSIGHGNPVIKQELDIRKTKREEGKGEGSTELRPEYYVP